MLFQIYILLVITSAIRASVKTAGCNEEGFYNIAHMTNTATSVDWALGQGANAVEIDLAFDGSGKATEFKHGGFCDCSCLCAIGSCSFLAAASVCTQLEASNKKICDASSNPGALLEHIATKPTMALVIIDGKVEAGDLTTAAMKTAGGDVVELLVTNLFEKGYNGKVIIASPKVNTIEYLKAAVEAMKKYSYHDRTFYSIDLEKRDIVETINELHTLPTQNIVYGTGISACAILIGQSNILRISLANKAGGVIGMNYIWTLDRESSIKSEMKYVQGILSNYPGKVTKVVEEEGIALAQPCSVIPVTTSTSVVSTPLSCDCDYHPGGCSISKVPPVNTACRCIYRGFWSCRGEVVRCKDPSSQYCKTPDSSIKTCILGGGDCDGYNEAKCDCDYHPGGCSISKVPPSNTACKCVYKGFWSCRGEVVKCKDFSNAKCTNPDSSIESCFQGDGDCSGYGNAQCDCDYHSHGIFKGGGCKIDKASPANTACKCNFKVFWSCNGRIVRCSDEGSQYCTSPDTSASSCHLGGGDCDGY